MPTQVILLIVVMVGGRVHQSLSIQDPGPKRLPPVDFQNRDQVNSLYQDLPPVLLTPQVGDHVTRVPKNGRRITFESKLDTSRLNFLRIITGTDMELGFMDCYLLLDVRRLVVHLLLLLRSNNLNLSILGRLL